MYTKEKNNTPATTEKKKLSGFKIFLIISGLAFILIAALGGSSLNTTSESSSPQISDEYNVAPESATPPSETQPSAINNPAALPTVPTMPQTTAHWHTVLTYSGDQNENTSEFNIRGSEWKISYSCAKTGTGAMPIANIPNNFEFALQPTWAETGNLVYHIVGVDCPNQGTVDILTLPAGIYYLDLATGGASYTVKVEDYY